MWSSPSGFFYARVCQKFARFYKRHFEFSKEAFKSVLKSGQIPPGLRCFLS